MTAQLVTDALVMAIWRRGKPDALLHHSDQGSQLGFNQSSQRSCELSVGVRQTPLQVFASREFCAASY
jgi:transposase InsO family protein